MHPKGKEMRHAQHGTKELRLFAERRHQSKKKKCRGMALTGPGQISGRATKTLVYARGMKVAWCGKRSHLRASEIKTDGSIG